MYVNSKVGRNVMLKNSCLLIFKALLRRRIEVEKGGKKYGYKHMAKVGMEYYLSSVDNQLKGNYLKDGKNLIKRKSPYYFRFTPSGFEIGVF